MQIRKKEINKILIFFLILHLSIWVLVPSLSNNNLPLDTIEALAWSSNLDWGYIKHPPFSAWSVEFVYQIFGNQDWGYYLLSQVFVVSSFLIIFKFSEDFFQNRLISLLSILVLEGIYFYNFTTPEFNVNVSQLPFWSLTVYFCWKGINKNDNISWLLFGLFAAFGVLSKYLFIYLLLAIDIFFIYLIIKKKFNYKCLVSLISFFIILLSHFFWLFENDYTTITYALNRTGIENQNFLDAHFLNPIIFLGKQIGVLIPFFIMLFTIISKFKPKINLKDKKLIFLLIINLVPIFLIFITSLIFGVTVRTMWMTPFYLFFGVLFLYIFKMKITFIRLRYFFTVFIILFIFSPAVYFYISMTQNNKRTDYPGQKISNLVQQKWNDNFTNTIGIVGGDEWHGGNLSYHLKSRPIWDNIFDTKKTIKPINNEDGFVFIGETDILSKICKGVFFEVESQGICMIGKKK